MPFLDHLEELRWRILWSLLACLVGVIAAFIFLQRFDIFLFLERPILPYLGGNKLKYTHPADPFSVLISASFTIGIVLALPVILYQVWAFLAPALYKNEKKIVLPVIFGAIVLFVSGVMLSFYVVLPLAIGWLMQIAANTSALEPMITYRDYFSFAVNMSLAFGLCFELPIVILLLALLGLVTPEFLRRFRRHALVLCVVTGALLSPGDLIWTTGLLAAPLYLLYELSVILTVLVYRRRRKREAALAAEEAAARAASGTEPGRDGPRRLDEEPWEDDASRTAWRGS
jgi:sec-independent protein translocase protein TatC